MPLRSTDRARSTQTAAALVLALGLGLPGGARAVPSFARQTGMPCTSCHTEFPQLTPFGRYFKMTGYTLGGGDTRLPPLAVMVNGGFTHTKSDLPPDDVPTHYKDNNNYSFTQASFFYAGRLVGPYAESAFGETVGGALDHVGTFVQGTWDGVSKDWAWDNAEIRAATTTRVADQNVIVGSYTNNNPSMQDPWNTTPAWSFPFSTSGLAPAPTASPLISGVVAQQVGGFGAYTMLADLLYLEVGSYTTLAQSAQRNLGVDPEGETQIDHFAPYWRVALDKNFGPHSAHLGTFGLAAHTFPGRDETEGHDGFSDVGVDAQYQYLSDRHDWTVSANWIHEHQSLDASHDLGLASNHTNTLWTSATTVQYLFDKTYAIDAQYFLSGGNSDALMYGSRTGSPGSEGWVFELSYLPFNKHGGPAFWPASNAKLSLQYTLYQRFDGSHTNYDGGGRSADGNDTIYVEAWLAF